MAEQLALLPGYLTAHLQLSLLALVLGALLSVPLGIWVTRRPSLEPGVLGFASVLQTVPSLALLALMVPLLASLASALDGVVELRSIGFLPAWIALTLYSVLPMLRNTVTGIAGVDPALVEAARGVGMTDRQRLLQVELPLAAPVIVAGVRTATVWVVGTATLATPVGATSLGNFIFSGLATRNTEAVLVGSVAAAALAVALDGLIRALETGLRTRQRARALLALGSLAALVAYSGVSLAWQQAGGAQRPVAIGSKAFTEQYILAELIAQEIDARTGVPTHAVPSLGSTVAFDALRTGEIDVYVDYSGTIWATILKREDAPGRAAVLAQVARTLEAEYDVAFAGELGFENTYALAMRADRAAQLGVSSISDLARRASRLAMGGDYEFFARREWAALETRYGLRFREQHSMDPSLMYQAVAEREVDVISAFSTDGRIAAFDLTVLADDLGVIPPYDAMLLASARLRRENPRVFEALQGLAGRIDADAMRRMNLAVDEAGRSAAAVAGAFLAELRDGG